MGLQFYQALHDEIPPSPFQPPAIAWNEVRPSLADASSPAELREVLKQIDQKILEHQAHIAVIDGKRVAFYDGSQPFSLQEQSLYARGLQFANSAIRLIEWEGLEPDISTLKDYIHQYTLKMQHLNANHTKESFAMAQKMTIDFIGLMANHIAVKRIQKNDPGIDDPKAQEKYFNKAYQQAFTDLRKATDLISSIEPNEDVICTYNRDADGQIHANISERLKFDGTETMDEIQTQRWYQQNLEKHGAWFESFVRENRDALLHCSPVCTTRDLPNPSNAWNEATVTFAQDGAIIQEQASKRVAITSPFQIKNRGARVEMAGESIEAIINPTELDSIAQTTHDKWGPLLEGAGEITLPILHQTLVAPTFFYGADRDMIEVKTESNATFRQNVLDGESRSIGENVYNFSLLETNNCINMWHPIINPRNTDIDDSQKLIQSANFLVGRLYEKTNQNADVKSVMDYLNNQKRSWIMIKPLSNRDPSPAQQQAIDRVIDNLKNGQMNESGLDAKQQKDLALVISAAVNLKKINHETHLGHAKRRLNNAVKINGISLLSPITGLISSPVYLGRYLFNSAGRLRGYLKDKHPPTLGAVFLPTLNGYKNKQTFKSAYESIIAGQFGMVFGGCKSAYDRAGEAKINQDAMLQEFARTGKLPDFHDSDAAYYRYLQTVSQVENAGHQYRVVASNDRIGARKLWEVLTHHYTQELSQDERDIAKKSCAKFRKIGSVPTGEAREAIVRDYIQISAPIIQGQLNVANTDSHPLPEIGAHRLSQAPQARSERQLPEISSHRHPRSQQDEITEKQPEPNSSPHRRPRR